MQTRMIQGVLSDALGYDVARIQQTARYKFALCRRTEREALNEARAIATGAERSLWERIARESRQDARRWVRRLRECNEALQCRV